MQRFLCFMCGFAEMMAFGAVLALSLPRVVAVVMLLVPVVLLVLSLVLPSWQRAARERRARVFVYVPSEQRQYPGQVYRPYVEDEHVMYQRSEEGW